MQIERNVHCIMYDTIHTHRFRGLYQYDATQHIRETTRTSQNNLLISCMTLFSLKMKLILGKGFLCCIFEIRWNICIYIFMSRYVCIPFWFLCLNKWILVCSTHHNSSTLKKSTIQFLFLKGLESLPQRELETLL